MKKSLIALAVLAASGAAMAQSSVTAYGLLDVWFGSAKSQVPGTASTITQTKLDSGGVDGDRWGLKGSEDLGGGLKANFKLEQGFAIDSGTAGASGDGTTGQAFSRYSYVGFSGGFGEVKLGKTGTAYDDVSGAADAVFDSALSAIANTWKSTGYIWNPANTIYYVSPNMSGFSGAISYSLGENKDKPVVGVDAGNIASLNIQYAGGPIAASLGYQSEKVFGNSDEKKFTRLNGSYNFNVAKLDLSYRKVSQNNNPDTNEYQIGVDFPVSSALTVSANYAYSKTDAGAAIEAKRTGVGIGAAYSLSKRTFVYGGVRAETTNDATTNGDLSTGLFAVGVHHTF